MERTNALLRMRKRKSRSIESDSHDCAAASGRVNLVGLTHMGTCTWD